MDQAVNATQLASPGSSLSLWGLFLQSDIVVKLVILCLLLASIWVWAIIFEKVTGLRRANRDANGFEDRFWSGGSLDELYDHEGQKPDHPMAAVFGAAMGEWRRTARIAGADISHTAVRERVDRAMNVTIQRELERMERWMIFLASVGSTAPFIGLFGTVWGILDSFEHISASYNTSLTVVAPGIAEALLATAVGLFAAIPATMFYNRFARELGKITGTLDNVAAELIVFASRDVERLGK